MCAQVLRFGLSSKEVEVVVTAFDKDKDGTLQATEMLKEIRTYQHDNDHSFLPPGIPRLVQSDPGFCLW